MSYTNKLLEKLLKSLFSPSSPSPLFIESQTKYIQPHPSSTPEIDTFLLSSSPKAYSIYKKLPTNENFKKLIYVLLCLSSRKPSIEEEIKAFIKQGALGIEISYFNSALLPSLRDKINYAVYNIIHVIYTHGLLYRQIKLESDRPASMTHTYFLEKSKDFLKEYETTVLECELDYLSFYSKMYILFKKIKKIGIINDVFKNRTHLIGFTKPIVSFENVSASFNNPLLKDYEDVIFKIYNECTISYCQNGVFEDPFGEFFIKNHVLDYGLIPPFIPIKIAETIAYIGKYTAFLKSINSLSISIEPIQRIDLSKRSSSSYLSLALRNLNINLKIEFFEKLKIFDLLKYIHSTFMFGRIDFIENFFSSLKESRKSGKKNILNILENCLNAAFPSSPFNSLMDIYILSEEKTVDFQPEGFSLYIKLSYPFSLLIEEDFAIKLVYVFKFLWKLKKIDHLARRTGKLKYILLSQKLMFYAFQEVIGAYKPSELNEDSFLFDEFKKNLSRRMDQIMKGLFINTKGKKIEHLLFNLEKALLATGNGEKFDESGVMKSFNEFYEFSKDSLTGTSLFDLSSFITNGICS